MFQFRTFFYPGNFLAKDFYAILSLQHIQLHIQILITRTHPCITENLSFVFITIEQPKLIRNIRV